MGSNVIDTFVSMYSFEKDIDISSEEFNRRVADVSNVKYSCAVDGIRLGLHNAVRVSVLLLLIVGKLMMLEVFSRVFIRRNIEGGNAVALICVFPCSYVHEFRFSIMALSVLLRPCLVHGITTRTSSSPPTFDILHFMAAQMRSDEGPPPSFFKVILQRTLQDKKLMIPIANWLEFVPDFSIQSESLLTFRLEALYTFEVSIYLPSGCEMCYPIMSTTPARKTNPEKGECSKTSLGSRQATQAWRNFKTEMPCFNILMQPYHFKHSIVHLPTKFSTILMQAPEFINLQTSEGRKWSVRLRKQVSEGKYNRFRLGNGWGDFRDENNLNIGDVCAIEIINDNLWKVTIFRADKQSPFLVMFN
ncbi:uncharacterized protein LOC130015561 [Mercurialis annua]|uniref:uncharacterized protein LOC130015561 n=1 Tax=Mercurialis annua TaxID=3986 RepID=UPI0024AD0F73|nr:uncharacterized protein LOC130015561 [Mercurialis annua]